MCSLIAARSPTPPARRGVADGAADEFEEDEEAVEAMEAEAEEAEEAAEAEAEAEPARARAAALLWDNDRLPRRRAGRDSSAPPRRRLPAARRR